MNASNPKKNELPSDSVEAFERAVQDKTNSHYILRLYVAGNTPRSKAAIENLHQVLEQHLQGRYQLDVVDIYQQPELAREHQIIAAPTLIKTLPLPLRKMIGDLSKEERILVGLDIVPVDGNH